MCPPASCTAAASSRHSPWTVHLYLWFITSPSIEFGNWKGYQYYKESEGFFSFSVKVEHFLRDPLRTIIKQTKVESYVKLNFEFLELQLSVCNILSFFYHFRVWYKDILVGTISEYTMSQFHPHQQKSAQWVCNKYMDFRIRIPRSPIL